METAFEILKTIFSALYIIVFVVAVIKLPRYKETPLKYFPLVLLFTIVAEFTGKYYPTPNIIVFNIYYFFYFSLLFYIFMKTIDEEKFKNYIKAGIVIYLVFYVRDLIFLDINTKSFTPSYVAGAGVLVYCIILYYIGILQSSKVLIVKNDLLFWVSVGLFLFYTGYLPIKIIRETWAIEKNEFFSILMVIQFVLIIVMYLFFLTGFLWMRKR